MNRLFEIPLLVFFSFDKSVFLLPPRAGCRFESLLLSCLFLQRSPYRAIQGVGKLPPLLLLIHQDASVLGDTPSPCTKRPMASLPSQFSFAPTSSFHPNFRRLFLSSIQPQEREPPSPPFLSFYCGAPTLPFASDGCEFLQPIRTTFFLGHRPLRRSRLTLLPCSPLE